jgi:hypothetical protein
MPAMLLPAGLQGIFPLYSLSKCRKTSPPVGRIIFAVGII